MTETQTPGRSREPAAAAGGAPVDVELQAFLGCWDTRDHQSEQMTLNEEMTMAKTTKKRATQKQAAKRELIAPRGDKRYIRRDAKGRIKESDDVRRSLSQDRRRKAKTKAAPGQGDRGDRKPAKARARKRTSARR